MPSEYKLLTDFRGKQFKLYDSTAFHIKRNHPDLKQPPLEFVKAILNNPIMITEDELPNTVIYHQLVRKPIMHIAYVEVNEERIKSAHITDRVKGGKLIWMKETKDLIS